MFKIETNLKYTSKRISKINKLKKIIECYDLKNVHEYNQIKKINLGSKIYFLEDSKKKYILRSALNRDSKQLEDQCIIASKVKKNVFFMNLL